MAERPYGDAMAAQKIGGFGHSLGHEHLGGREIFVDIIGHGLQWFAPGGG